VKPKRVNGWQITKTSEERERYREITQTRTGSAEINRQQEKKNCRSGQEINRKER